MKGNADNVALFCRSRLNELKRFGRHADFAAGAGNALRFRLGADIDHVRVALGVEVRESVHIFLLMRALIRSGNFSTLL